MSSTPQFILVYAEKMPRPIWLDSKVFKGPYASVQVLRKQIKNLPLHVSCTCLLWGLNPRPPVYETGALPLS